VKHTIEVESETLLLLDGKCDAKTQDEIERLKSSIAIAKDSSLPEREAAMVVEIVSYARKNGRLTYQHVQIKRCPCCNRFDGYWPVRRSTRFKTKGNPDHDHPKVFSAIDLGRGFLTFPNFIFIGYCESCKPRVEPVLLPLIQDLKAEFPKHWEAAPHKWKRYDNQKCNGCGWVGHEGQMIHLHAIMGGTYPGQCPKCGAQNVFLGRRNIESIEGFTMVEQKPLTIAATPP